jgi:DNA polymerase-3 subunit delta'
MSWNLIGHEWAAELLAKHISQGSVRHAYLITGPESVGRGTLALRFAQALNCNNPPAPGQACQKCTACKRIERQQHPDLSLVEAEQVGGTLKIEAIRELLHWLALAPYEARYRVALLRRFEEASGEAQNALLKTLEEPNPQVILLLTAQNAESIFETIVSRCEVIRLHPVGAETLHKGLVAQKKVPDEQANLLAHIAGGRPGYALRMIEDENLLEERKTWISDAWTLAGAGRVERFAYAHKQTYLKEREYMLGYLALWSSFWHDILLRCSGSAATLTNLDYTQEVEYLAKQLEPGSARRVVETIEQTMANIRRNINPRLAMEVLMLEMPRLKLS